LTSSDILQITVVYWNWVNLVVQFDSIFCKE
jgi:hypothetical protein